MTIHKYFTVGALCVALVAAFAVGAEAQVASTRGTLKVQPRFFNPFDVSSRFTLNPFGMLEVASPTSTSSSSALTSSGSLTGGDGGSGSSSFVIVPAAAPPPFRPPVRSPFRPPPRLPLVPP